MKSAVIPPVRVEPGFRAELDAVLRHDETLSEFIASAVRSAVHRRREQTAFRRRGEAAWIDYQATGQAAAAADVMARLQGLLEARRRQLQA